MTSEIASRLLALAVVAGVAWLMTRGRLPVIPPGRWTVLAFLSAGFGMCTLAGIRDGLDPASALPQWLTMVSTILGITALVAMLAVIAGLSWRTGVVVVAGVIGANWLLALGHAFATGSDAVLSGVLTPVAAVVVWVAIDRVSLGHAPVAGAAS